MSLEREADRYRDPARMNCRNVTAKRHRNLFQNIAAYTFTRQIIPDNNCKSSAADICQRSVLRLQLLPNNEHNMFAPYIAKRPENIALPIRTILRGAATFAIANAELFVRVCATQAQDLLETARAQDLRDIYNACRS